MLRNEVLVRGDDVLAGENCFFRDGIGKIKASHRYDRNVQGTVAAKVLGILDGVLLIRRAREVSYIEDRF